MSAQDTHKPSKTNWERIDAMADDEIDTSDIPPLDDSFFERAVLRVPRHSITVTMRLDADVFDWFRSLGPEYEQRINAALRLYAESHKAYSR